MLNVLSGFSLALQRFRERARVKPYSPVILEVSPRRGRSVPVSVSEGDVRQALQSVRFPGLSKDIVSFGFVEAVHIRDGIVRVRLNVPAGSQQAAQQIAREAQQAVEALAGLQEVKLEVATPKGTFQPSAAAAPPDQPLRATPGGVQPASGGPPVAASQPASPLAGERRPTGRPAGPSGVPAPMIDRSPLEGVRHVVAVASGKGGVGKSTVAVNLAAALSQLGERVGLMDADIYGPSVPTMLGIHEEPQLSEVAGRRVIIPVHKFGMQLMSLGFIQPEDDPVIWRGPLVMKAVRQFLRDVDWRGTHTLVIDLPPGTGDAQLTLTQSAPLDGAIIVSTPQDVALIDARKGLAMFREVDVPVLGMVENMSYYRCDHCGEETHIFKHGGARETAARLEVPFLGEIPIDPEVARCGDDGTPVVVQHPDSIVANAFREIAVCVQQGIAEKTTSDRDEVVN